MKRIQVGVMLLLLSFFWTACASMMPSASKSALTTPEEKVSYVIGMDVGKTLKTMEHEVRLPVIYQAIEDTLHGKDLLLTPEEAAEVKKAYAQKVREQRARTMEELSEKNIKEGEAFLAENKSKEGVITTDSGLQYMVLNKADGPKPVENAKVQVHYRGTLLDGTEFDSSYKRGNPASFNLKGVIKGWTEGLQLMPVGSTYRFFIPSELAYGERGSGQKIGPNAALVFDVELLGIDED